MKRVFIISIFILAYLSGISQSSNSFNYQAVARNASGGLITNKIITLKVTILQGDANGEACYSEIFSPQTNNYGLVNLSIGSTYPDEFDKIDWQKGPYFIQVEMDPDGGNNFVLNGTSQLLSVPFALYAQKSGVVNEKDPLFSVWDKSTGILISRNQITDLDSLLGNDNFQKELDYSQLQIGLSSDGSYSPSQLTHFLKNTYSFYNADSILDQQIYYNNYLISRLQNRQALLENKIDIDSTYLKNLIDSENTTLQSELDQTQTGAGLANDGTYTRNSGANYINDAASLNNADVKLDTQLKTTSDNLATEIADREADVNAEETARIAADIAINTEMDADSTYLKNLIDSKNSTTQSELDVTQTGAGLANDGTYTKNSGANYIDNAASLNNADVKLDTQLKTTSDNLATEIADRQADVNAEESARIAADNAINTEMDADSTYLKNLIDSKNSTLQSELDQTQTGAGLANDGTYTKNSGANYIDNAASLNNADVKLDTQLKTTSDNLATEIADRQADVNAEETARIAADIAINTEMDADSTYLKNLIDSKNSTLQSELDQTQTGAGLASDGTYTKNSGANYIDDATSLNDADVILDTQLKTTSDNLATEIADREADVNAEESARIAADNAINTEMDADSTYLKNLIDSKNSTTQSELDVTQTGAGLANDGTYTKNSGTNYINDAASLNNADVKLDTQLKTSSDNLATEIADREADVNAEESARIAADNAINTEMDADSTYLKNLIDSKNSTLQSELDQTQTGAGLANDGTYTKNSGANYIDDAASLNNADVKIDAQLKTTSDNLATEIADREADVNAEETARITADIAINTEIDADSTYLKNLIDSKNSTLQSELDQTQTGAGLANDGTYTKNSGANYIDDAASLNNADVKLDAQLKTTSDNLATEITDRQADVNTEETARIAADIAINTEMDADSTYLKNLIDSKNSTTQSELDVTQTGAGLANDGTYTKNSGANYIDDAASLNNADVKLDTQLKTTSDNLATEIADRQADVNAEATARIAADIAINTEMDTDSTYLKNLIDSENTALQSELDQTQTGAGLANDGTYTKNSGANYIDDAASLNNADVKLDTQLKTNETAIALNTSKTSNATHTGDVTGSTALTIGADKVLDSHINWGSGTNQVSTADIPEQTNLYYTDARVAANSAVTANTAKTGITITQSTNIANNTTLLGATAGTATASKAVVLNGSKDISGLNNVNAEKVTGENVQTNSYFYFGDPSTDGTWRMYPTDDGLIFECRESGSWVEKMTILK